MCVEVCDMNVHMLLLEPDCLMWVQHVNVTETQVCCLFVSLSGTAEDTHLSSPYFTPRPYFMSVCGDIETVAA